MISDAKFSCDRVHRYSLTRTWIYDDEEIDLRRHVHFILLNPSTADESKDDPTMRRCIGYAKTWGFDGMVVTNIFAFRATDPRDMKAAADPVGPDNDRMIEDMGRRCGMNVAAWSQHGNFSNRSFAVRKLLSAAGVDLHVFRMGKGGEPCHPLYLPRTLKPLRWIQTF